MWPISCAALRPESAGPETRLECPAGGRSGNRQACILKITDKLLQSAPEGNAGEGASQISMVARAIDSRAACLLMEFYNYERLSLHMVWLLISVVYPAELHVPVLDQMKDLEKLYSDYSGKVFAISARQILLQCMPGIHFSPLNAIETMKLGCWAELGHDRVEAGASALRTAFRSTTTTARRPRCSTTYTTRREPVQHSQTQLDCAEGGT